MELTNNKILITGGASGIGLGLTERFIRENNTVIICGRRESVLKEVADKFPSVITKVCDLSVEAERVALFEWVSENHADLNVLVNNAGVQQWMSIAAEDFFQRAKNEIVTNIEAPLHLMSLFINLESLNTIINVTSGLSFVPFTKVPVYSATKTMITNKSKCPACGLGSVFPSCFAIQPVRHDHSLHIAMLFIFAPGWGTHLVFYLIIDTNLYH